MVWPRLNDSRMTIFRSLLFTGSLGGMLRDSKQKIVAEAKAASGMGHLLGRLFYLEITLQCDITIKGLNHAPSRECFSSREYKDSTESPKVLPEFHFTIFNRLGYRRFQANISLRISGYLNHNPQTTSTKVCVVPDATSRRLERQARP